MDTVGEFPKPRTYASHSTEDKCVPSAKWRRASIKMCRFHFAEATRTTARAIRLLLSRAGLTWQNRRVTFLGPDPQVFTVGKFHFDLAEFAVVIAVSRLVSDKILAAQLARDSRQPVLQFIHIRGKVCASSCLFGQAHEVFAFLAINQSR